VSRSVKRVNRLLIFRPTNPMVALPCGAPVRFRQRQVFFSSVSFFPQNLCRRKIFRNPFLKEKKYDLLSFVHSVEEVRNYCKVALRLFFPVHVTYNIIQKTKINSRSLHQTQGQIHKQQCSKHTVADICKKNIYLQLF
jgi:hypothetical protein